MIYLTSATTSRMLGITPQTLRCWQERFGVPHALRSLDGHVAFASDEVIALRRALQAAPSITAAARRLAPTGDEQLAS